MQLTTPTLLAATVLTVTAKRQTSGIPQIYARFFNNDGCSSPEDWAEDTVFIHNSTVRLAGWLLGLQSWAVC
jgi:hypothetical protein